MAVIGLPDHRLGEISAAIIELNRELNVQKKIFRNSVRNFRDIRDLVRSSLQMFRVILPERFEKTKASRKNTDNTSGCGTEPGIIKYVKMSSLLQEKSAERWHFFTDVFYNSGENKIIRADWS